MTVTRTEPTSTTWPSSSGSKSNDGLGERMDGDRQPVLEREAAVPRDVVGVGVRLEHALDPHARLGGGLEDGVDQQGRVDDHRHTSLRVADQVTGAAQIVVHELPTEQHECGA